MKQRKQTWIKLAIALLTILALAVVMSVTKPSEEKYNSWVLEKVSDKPPSNPFKGLGLSLFGERLISEGTTMTDYGVVRLFQTEIMGQRIKVVGVLGTFIPLGKPDNVQ